MSSVRVLVGTRKGAFILTSDGKRQKWDVSGPHFGGWEIYHVKGSPADPNRLYASQSSGWFGQVMQRSNDGGKTWEPVGNKFVYADGGPNTHMWYDGTPHPWEFKRVWHFEPSLDRSRHRVRRRRGRRDVQDHRRRSDLERAARTSRPRLRSALAAGRGRLVPAHDPDRSDEPRSDLHRHLRRRRVPIGRRRRDVEADQPRARVAIHSRAHGRGRPLRAPDRDAPIAAQCALHAEALGRPAHRRCG